MNKGCAKAVTVVLTVTDRHSKRWEGKTIDRLKPEERSLLMSRIGNKNTKPERIVRSVLHRLGFRFRLHRRDLLGKPDIVLPRFKAAVFVQGCFWHRHKGCRDTTTPKTNTAFWVEKFRKNVERDKKVHKALIDAGWKVMVVWECETGRPEELAKRMRAELHGSNY